MMKERLLVKRIAAERVQILFDMANREMQHDPDLAKDYIKILDKISVHYKVKLPKEIKNRICKVCKSLLVPGFNATVKIASKNRYVIYRCSNCGTEKHIH